jgi:cell wall assembly regulator SMI1
VHWEIDMSERFAELLTRIDRCLEEQRPECYALLTPGVDEATLDRLEQHLGFSLPAEFRQLYRWRNGNREQESFSHNSYFMPLEEVESSYDVLTGMIGADFEEPDWWRADWIPFLASWGGNHLCIDLGGAFSGRPGQVLEFVHDGRSRPIVAPSLEDWLDAYVRALEDREWADEDGMWSGELKAIAGYPIYAKVPKGAPRRPEGVPEEARWDEEDSEWVSGRFDEQGRKDGVIRYHRPDGALCAQTAYRAGAPHGAFQRFHDNGEVSRDGEFVEGALHGTNRFYRSSAPTRETFPQGLAEAVWRSEMDFDRGALLSARYYDRDGHRLRHDGVPCPAHPPAAVPANAGFALVANQPRWIAGRTIQKGSGWMRTGLWKYWTEAGTLAREETYDKASGALLDAKDYLVT